MNEESGDPKVTKIVKTTKVWFRIRRQTTDDEVTYATVRAVVPAGPLEDPVRFREALKVALNDWMANTVDGRSAWDKSKHKFNVQDLGWDIGKPELDAFLKKVGITNMTIDIESVDCFCDTWEFDTVLADGPTKPFYEDVVKVPTPPKES